jgi:prepilin-type N-terminal cleavage/methylation domain-containing protein
MIDGIDKKISRQAGFTLVELLISIAVIGIVGVGIAALFYTVQYTQRRALNHDTATRAVQREIEVLRNSSYNSLPNGQDIIFTNDLPDILPGNKSGRVRVSEPTPGIKRVDVVVIYYDNGQKQEVNMSSLIGVIGIAQ